MTAPRHIRVSANYPTAYFREDRDSYLTAMEHYSNQYESFCETQQVYAHIEGLRKDCGKAAFLFLRAYTAELRDPEPGGTFSCRCAGCMAYALIPSSAKPPMAIESLP